MKHWILVKVTCNNCLKKDEDGFETKFNETKANGKILRLCVECFRQMLQRNDNAWNKFKSQKNPYLSTSDMLT